MKIDNEKAIDKKTKKSKKQRSNRRGSSYSEDDGDNQEMESQDENDLTVFSKIKSDLNIYECDSQDEYEPKH